MLVIAIAALAAACGPGASESHNSSQAGATARAGNANASLQPEVTLTGCLQNADRPEGQVAGTTGQSGGGSAGKAMDQMTAGKGSIGERFTLTNAKSASSASDPAASSYILDGQMDQLRAHVNQQVSVKGRLDAAASNTAGPQRIRVETVESIASNCAQE